MRLLDTRTGQFAEREPEGDPGTTPIWALLSGVPETEGLVYAILSHTWDTKEQTYGELRDIQRRYDVSVSQVPQECLNITNAPRDSALLTQRLPTCLGHLSQPDLEALFRKFVEEYNLPIRLQSLTSIPECVRSSGERDSSGPSPATPPLPEQPQPDCSSATTPLIRQYKPYKSCFTRGMARLKTWFQCCSSRNASHLLRDCLSPSLVKPPRTAHEHHPSLVHNEGGPGQTVATPSQLPNGSESPSMTTHPPTVIGRLTQPEVEALFRTFIEKYNPRLSLSPNPIPNDPHTLSQEHGPSSPLQSNLLLTTPRSHTDFGRLTESEVDALLRAVAETYHLAGPTPAPASKAIWEDPDLSPKIREACRVARENGYRYIWIDSCCIDKSSSSELSEAINSMYKWYALAKVCYAYLADVPPGEDHQAEGSAFRKSRWFGRGWMLQELIAPLSVEFLSNDWTLIGSKHALVDVVESVTKIEEKALLHLAPLDEFSVAQRFSWAANRKTKRVEDRAYSLLGIFSIKMPTLYGEDEYAFQRLQERIMQRIPDQSLFVWEDIYQSSRIFSISDNWEAWPDNDPPDFFSNSPDLFLNGHGITTVHHAIQTTTSESSHVHGMIEYTSTPYGIRTQFRMIPLTLDLLLRATQHSGDVKLGFSRSPKDSQWYLAILECEHSEYPEHLLGRVCYITPSKYGVDFLRPGSIMGIHLRGEQGPTYHPDLFPLSSQVIESFCQHTELKTIYIPNPNRADLLSRIQRQPYTAIKLVLVRATRDALRSQGYSVDLRDPDPDHPTTHWLTLSKRGHAITVEFQHTLEDGGKEFTIHAEVKMLGSHVQVDSTPDSDQADRHIVSWSDSRINHYELRIGWSHSLDHKSVSLSAAGRSTLAVDLGLDFGGGGVYILRLDVLSDALPAPSAVELAVYQGEKGERIEEGSPSVAIETEDFGREDTTEEVGSRCETAPSAEAAEAPCGYQRQYGGWR